MSLSAPFVFGPKDDLTNLRAHDFPLAESNLIRILGRSVAESACEEDGTLHLSFSSGDALVVFANDPRYEAYTLRIDGSEYWI